MPARLRSRLVPALLACAAMLATMLPARAGAAQITIVRDRFGVPHIYGATAADVSYGAGYALAQDRLWQMHVFRLVAKGRLSHLLGSVIVASDKTVRFWTYTAAERAERFATYPADIRENLIAFVAGANAYIAEVRADPARKLPLEFAQFGETLEDWTLDDSLAMSDYLIYTFGSGGGSEVNNLAALQQLKAKFGETQGAAAFDDLVWTNDPDAPVSIPEDFDWHANDSRARPEADLKTLHEDARRAPPEFDKIAGSAAGVPGLTQEQIARIPVSPHVLADIEALSGLNDPFSKLFFKFGSNAQIAGPGVTDTGNTMGTAGPQVGLFVPQALTDFGLHSADGKLDATGMTFAGAGPAVLIGRGRGYHWTTTTGASDLTDTFVEKLHPQNSRQYLFNPEPSDPSKARWENMDCRTEVYAIKGVQFDTQEICRTRHGPILSWDVANGVAYAVRYAWFNREGGTVEGFFRYNESRSIEDFATYSNLLASNHNMFYTDDQGNIGYWHPGNFPVRAPGDLRLPFSGTGEQEWRGLLKAQDTPHAVYVHGDNDPTDFRRQWLANWNNKPAIDWDRESGWGAFDRTKSLIEALDPATPVADPWGGTINADGKVSWQDLNANLRYGAFRDFNADFIQRFLPAAGANENEQRALDACRGYNGAIYDDNGDGFVDSSCYTILNRFVADLRSTVFSDDLPSAILGRANASTSWHVLAPEARLVPKFDWLNGKSREAARAAAFTTTVNALTTQFGSGDPAAWRTAQPTQHYTRLNSGLVTDVGLASAGVKGGQTPLPGDTPDQIRMNRGTYNHIVAYLDPPTGSGELGESRDDSGSVIAPGQSGFIDLTGRESRHYRSQFKLYQEWRYKPMPMTLAEARAVGESEVVLTRP